MKTLMLALALLISAPAYAATITATATANVIRSVITATCSSLSFGSINKNSSAGAITLTPESKRHVSGKVSLGDAPFHAASCAVRGTPNSSYHIQIPESVSFTTTPTHSNTKNMATTTLHVDAISVWSANRQLTNLIGTTDAEGLDSLRLGGTLHVTANAAPGIYQGIIPVTLNY